VTSFLAATGGLVGHAPGFELLGGEQVQEVLLAIAVNPLLRMGRAAQLAALGPAGAAGCVAQGKALAELKVALLRHLGILGLD